MSDIYKQALRQNLRFAFKGLRSVEELWELRLEDLDEIFQGLNISRKAKLEESLLSKRTSEATELDLKIEIINEKWRNPPYLSRGISPSTDFNRY
jgi:hypothetical protein